MGNIFYKSKICLAYANDIALIARNKEKLGEMFERLETYSKIIGLRVNVEKTKYL